MNDQVVPAEIAKVRATPEFKRALRLADREWRLDSLYWILDENGQKIRFVRNEAQRILSAGMHSRDIIPKSRKLGVSTFIAVLICDSCVFRTGTVAGIVDRTLDDAEDKLKMVKFAYDNLPPDIRAGVPTITANTQEIRWANGSSVSVGITYRGGTPFILHISEYGKISVDKPDIAREIKTGAVQAVPIGGKVFIESTAHGTSGEFCDMVKKAQDLQFQKTPLTQLDFKLHFFGWWLKREYRLPNHLVRVTQELKEYFEELEAKDGIKLDADQRAWYAKKYEELGPDDAKQEFPSTSAELFYASLQGAYFKREMTQARKDGRIGGMVPFDRSRRVNTCWDIGEDGTAVGFHQTDGVRHRFIDYFEEEGGSIQSAAGVVMQKARERGFVYQTHYGPHDVENKVWGAHANTILKIAEDLGIKFKVVPRIDDKADSIEAARRMINMSWFDVEHCSRLVDCLDNYCKKWNATMAMFMAEPIHNWSSHGSDAYQQIAMGLTPDRPEKTDRHRNRPPPRTSQWAA